MPTIRTRALARSIVSPSMIPGLGDDNRVREISASAFLFCEMAKTATAKNVAPMVQRWKGVAPGKQLHAEAPFRRRVEPPPKVPPIPRPLRDDEALPVCVMPTVDQLTDPDPFTFAMDCVVTQDHPDMLIDVSAEHRGSEVVGIIEQER